jgi:hypothetical protein
MTRRVPCILCHGTDYAADCAAGQCHAEQLDLIDGNRLNDPGPPQDLGHFGCDGRYRLPAGRHDRGWPRH